MKPNTHPAANERRHGPRKARVMWADPIDGDIGPEQDRLYRSPVLVLPLDPASLAALEKRVAKAMVILWERESGFCNDPKKTWQHNYARAALGAVAKELVGKEQKP